MVLAALVAVVAAGCGDDGPDAAEKRQADVAERGAEVMPFDLDATTHRFTPTERGLVQVVTVDAPVDPDQVRLVREHLGEEAARFAAGDFADPAAIHGDDMAGLDVLEERAGEVDVRYADLPNGGRITYRTSDVELRRALHDWADAQVADHGAHAEGG